MSIQIGVSRSLRSAAQSVGFDNATNKEERLMLLEAWSDFETQYGDESSRSAIAALLPKRVKKRRRIQTQDGVLLSPIDKLLSTKHVLFTFSLIFSLMPVGKNTLITSSQKMKRPNLILSCSRWLKPGKWPKKIARRARNLHPKVQLMHLLAVIQRPKTVTVTKISQAIRLVVVLRKRTNLLFIFKLPPLHFSITQLRFA